VYAGCGVDMWSWKITARQQLHEQLLTGLALMKQADSADPSP